MDDNLRDAILSKLADSTINDAKRLAGICATQHVLSQFIASQTGRDEREVLKEIQHYEQQFELHLLGGLQDNNPVIAKFLNDLRKQVAPRTDRDPPKAP